MYRLSLIVLIVWGIELQANCQCDNNNIVYPANSIQQGIYKTNGTIESAGTINNKAKFMASDRVILQSGFSVNAGTRFSANNLGCMYNENYCIESYINPSATLSMFTPLTYPNAGIFFGDDTWIYGNSSINQDVSFGIEQGPGTPGSPTTLTLPLPAMLGSYDQMEMIYSASENGAINGVLYYKYTNATFRNVQAVYLHKNDVDEYTTVLFISYADNKHEEVVSILETVNSNGLDLNDCLLITNNNPFAIYEDGQYCFADELNITVNEIDNSVCCSFCDPFCSCPGTGSLSIEMTIADEAGNIADYTLFISDQTLFAQNDTSVNIVAHNNWVITLVNYTCGGYNGDITISVVNEDPESKACQYVDFKYYQDQPLSVGEMSAEYIVIGSNSLNNNNEIADLIESKNYFDQNYEYNISSYENYPFKQVALKLNYERSCQEITAIIADLKSNAYVDYAHYGMQTDNCTNDIWETIGDLCINSYSSIFAVKVFDENDLTDLINLMQETNTTLVKQNQFIPQWFHLRADKNSSGDALQMANYFYETGLIEHSEPDIIKIPVE